MEGLHSPDDPFLSNTVRYGNSYTGCWIVHVWPFMLTDKLLGAVPVAFTKIQMQTGFSASSRMDRSRGFCINQP